ncbi:MAG: hypothetical protein K0Q66_354 [Chitinophagaceae bacterium]|jgi:hypothetical protein|nr:hypothetical protein [Chitinophagaceae bacterium]
MSWGNKLVIVFLAFAGLMATLVYKAVNTKFELVTKDYYKDELRYQETIEGRANASQVGELVLIQDGSTVTLTLPVTLGSLPAEGEAWFYCKTNAGNDRRIPVRMEGGRFVFDKAQLATASYELKLTVTAGGKQYYFTAPISIG